MKPVVLAPAQWKNLLKILKKDYPMQVFMLRSRMKKVLGFTVREHTAWKPNPNYEREYRKYLEDKNTSIYDFSIEPAKGLSTYEIHLDFYSERKRDFFLLKYSEFISRRENYGTSASWVV